MTESERSLLTAFLLHDFEGVEVLRRDGLAAKVTPGCDCGCGSIRFVLPDGDPPLVAEHPVPIEATVNNDDGHAIGGLLLFERGGHLRELEIYSIDGAPLALPDLDRVIWETIAR